jgi:hypothetical protein
MPEIIHGWCWRTGCSKEYLDLRGMNWQEASGSFVMRSFVICTHNPTVIRMMKSKRMRWAGDVRTTYKTLVERRKSEVPKRL